MSITDELRKFAWKECPSKFLERVIGIADDIDAALAYHIPLPKDADGETIHIGDKVTWLDEDLVRTVCGFEVLDCDNDVRWFVRARGICDVGRPDQLHHAQLDSWERIIEDAAKNIYPNGAFNPCWDEVSAELVERCKRLAGEDE